MKFTLAEHFRRKREKLGIARGELARRLGYRNIAKGARRIHLFETEGEIPKELLWQLAGVLEVDQATVERLARQDDERFLREWSAWANEPIEPYLVVRVIPAIYTHLALPPHVASVEAAENFAAEVARERRKQCCLVLSRRLSVYFDEAGDVKNRMEAVPGQPHGPYMTLAGKGRAFLWRPAGPDALEEVSWPRRRGPEAGA